MNEHNASSEKACPKCGYVYGPLETTCRRCASGISKPIEHFPEKSQPPKKSSWGIFAAIVIVIAVVGSLVYLGLGRQGGIKLEYKFSPGQENKYNIAMSVSMQMPAGMPNMPKSINLKLDGQYSQKVLSVNKDGSAKVEIAMRNMRITSPTLGNLVPATVPDQMKVVTMSKTGSTSTENGEETGITQLLGGKMGQSPTGMGALLPARGVNVGDTWTEKVKLGKDAELLVTSKLISDNAIFGSKKACKIEQDYKADIDLEKASDLGGVATGNAKGTMQLSGRATIHFSQEEGRLLNDDAQIKMVINSPDGTAAQKMNMAISMKLAN